MSIPEGCKPERETMAEAVRPIARERYGLPFMDFDPEQ
jgi:hypothetical protein